MQVDDLKTINVSLEPTVVKGAGFQEVVPNVFVKTEDLPKTIVGVAQEGKKIEDILNNLSNKVTKDLVVRIPSDLPTMNPILGQLVDQLTKNDVFLASLEVSVKNILANGNNFSLANVPELVHVIASTLSCVSVPKESLSDFVRLVFEFVCNKYNLVSKDKFAEFEEMLVSSVKLVLLTPTFEAMATSCLPKLFSLCVPSRA